MLRLFHHILQNQSSEYGQINGISMISGAGAPATKRRCLAITAQLRNLREIHGS